MRISIEETDPDYTPYSATGIKKVTVEGYPDGIWVTADEEKREAKRLCEEQLHHTSSRPTEWIRGVDVTIEFEDGYRELIEEERCARNAPFFGDGHDCDGFAGGCERMGCPGGENCTAAKEQSR